MWATCTLYRKTGTDGNGQPTYGTGIPISDCAITYKTKIIKRDSGSDILSVAQVTFPAEVIPCVQDKIMLSDGNMLEVQDVSLATGAYGAFSHSVAWL